MASPQPPRTSKLPHKKLPRLPENAKIRKRPLHRPAIPSQHTNSAHQKVVYISTHTPFLSAVKRVEKLLALSDARLVQSATTTAQQQNGRGGKKRKREGDDILAVAEEVERIKQQKVVGEGNGEAVLLKGTGKAIHRVLELALWFQQRAEQYVVRLRTGSVGAIDDIEVEDGGRDEAEEGADEMEVDEQQATKKKQRKKKAGKEEGVEGEVPETRMRYASVLEAAVSLR